MTSHERHGISNHRQPENKEKNQSSILLALRKRVIHLPLLVLCVGNPLIITGPLCGESIDHYWSFAWGIHWSLLALCVGNPLIITGPLCGNPLIITGSLWGESNVYQRSSLTKAQWCRKCFYVMTSSCSSKFLWKSFGWQFIDRTVLQHDWKWKSQPDLTCTFRTWGINNLPWHSAHYLIGPWESGYDFKNAIFYFFFFFSGWYPQIFLWKCLQMNAMVYNWW